LKSAAILGFKFVSKKKPQPKSSGKDTFLLKYMIDSLVITFQQQHVEELEVEQDVTKIGEK